MDALAYDEQGTGTCVVLLHGHPFNRSMWEHERGALSDRFRVIAPDLRGYGESPVTPGVAPMSELAGDVRSLLDERGVGELAVIGLSMGGLVAMELALAQPDRIWALGLVATTAQPVTDAERAARLAMADRVEAVGMAPLVEEMAPRLFGPAADEDMVERVLAMMGATDPRGAAAAMRGRVERPDYRAGLRELDVPSFVCTGACDTWSTAEVTRELLGCLKAPHTLTLPDVGHLPNLERPDAFAAALGAFLDGAWRQRR
jgi:pimeloyl-ACP methyl ester carboxylesterase